VKMSEGQRARRSSAHFKKGTCSGRMAAPNPVEVIAIPHLSHAQLARTRSRPGPPNTAFPLVNQVTVLGEPIKPCPAPPPSRARIDFLQGQQQRPRSEVAHKGPGPRSRVGRNTVQEGQIEFDSRYPARIPHLGHAFRRFDEALVRLLDMPGNCRGVGRFVSGTLYVLRTPYRPASRVWLPGR